MAGSRKTPQAHQTHSGSASGSGTTGSADTQATADAIIDETIAAEQQKIEKLQELKRLKEQSAQLELELSGSTKRRRRSDSSSSSRVGEIKIANIPKLPLYPSFLRRKE